MTHEHIENYAERQTKKEKEWKKEIKVVFKLDIENYTHRLRNTQ